MINEKIIYRIPLIVAITIFAVLMIDYFITAKPVGDDTPILPMATETTKSEEPVQPKLTMIDSIIASWYSVDHCLGCSEERIMANGQPLNDSEITCAYNKVSLGTMLIIRHFDKEIKCPVTDRIGYNDRIDLTPAAFTALGFDLDNGLGKVEIFVEKN